MTLKDLVEGAKAAAAIKDNREWKEARPAQVSVKEADLVAEVRKILARHTGTRLVMPAGGHPRRSGARHRVLAEHLMTRARAEWRGCRLRAMAS